MKPEIDDILVKLYPVYKDLPEADFINDQDDIYTKDDFWDDLSNKEKYNVNSLYLKMIGDPKHDYIMCWEPGRFDENEAVTDYTNFYDVDYKWWEFQKNANWSNIEDQKKMMMSGSKTYTPEKVAESINYFNDEYSEYKISMTGDWYRLIERDIFIYAEMISLKWYLFYKAECFLDSLQEEHIPYELKDADFETLLNTRDPEEKYNAAGREKELESFYTKIRVYLNNDLLNQIDNIIRKYKRVFSGKTFRIDKGYNDGSEETFDPFTNFIFFDELSLKRVNPQNFLQTFRENQIDNKELEHIVNEFLELVKINFDEIYHANRSRYI